MARIKLLPDDELTDATRAAAQHMDAQGMDTSTLRGLANSPELFEAYNAFTCRRAKDTRCRKS